MMRRIFFISIIIGYCLLALSLPAQEPKVYLRYFENISGNMRLVSQDLKEELNGVELEFNIEIPNGWTILTENGDFVELELEPGGTIIKIAENTNFRLEKLQGLNKAAETEFSLTFGKFRAIVAKITGQDQFTFKGQGATCGVRGTDFGMQILEDLSGKTEEAFVFKGEIDYTQLGTGKKISVKAGQMANAWAEQFASFSIPQDKLNALRNNLEFKKLAANANQEAKGEGQDKDKDKEKDKTADADVAPPDEKAKQDKKSKAQPAAEQPGMLDWLFKLVGLEIGSITIEDTVYAKAVLTPTFKIGKLDFSLYLPVIYTNDMFDPANWYQPKGNNEWSFGFDHTDQVDVAIFDAFQDLFLKIKYVKWGEQRDPFFFKLGNLNDMTIGHGILMQNFANDADFPSVRRLGINLGLGLEHFGIEAVVNDVLEPEIFGGRIFVKPLGKGFPMAIGLSSVVDIAPAGDLDDVYRASIGDPLLISSALDIDFPIVETETAGLVLFADGAVTMPWFRSAFANVEAGPAFSSIISDLGLRNFGAAAGAFGNVGPFDWRAELRLSNGIFKPYAVNGTYERLRAQYAILAATYMMNPAAEDFNKMTLGIYGEGGYTLENIFSLTLGYHWPLSFSESGGIEVADDDYLRLEAALLQGAIPGIKLGISVAYDRNSFVPMLQDIFDGGENTYGFLDAYSQFKTSAIYGLTDNMDILMVWTTVAARDENGNVRFDGSLLPELETSLTIETQLHF